MCPSSLCGQPPTYLQGLDEMLMALTLRLAFACDELRVWHVCIVVFSPVLATGAGPRAPRVVLPDRALCLPNLSHLLIASPPPPRPPAFAIPQEKDRAYIRICVYIDVVGSGLIESQRQRIVELEVAHHIRILVRPRHCRRF